MEAEIKLDRPDGGGKGYTLVLAHAPVRLSDQAVLQISSEVKRNMESLRRSQEHADRDATQYK